MSINARVEVDDLILFQQHEMNVQISRGKEKSASKNHLKDMYFIDVHSISQPLQWSLLSCPPGLAARFISPEKVAVHPVPHFL